MVETRFLPRLGSGDGAGNRLDGAGAGEGSGMAEPISRITGLPGRAETISSEGFLPEGAPGAPARLAPRLPEWGRPSERSAWLLAVSFTIYFALALLYLWVVWFG